MKVSAKNCVGSVYSNQKSVGCVITGFSALACEEKRNRLKKNRGTKSLKLLSIH
jgi:hypothetical protein